MYWVKGKLSKILNKLNCGGDSDGGDSGGSGGMSSAAADAMGRAAAAGQGVDVAGAMGDRGAAEGMAGIGGSVGGDGRDTTTSNLIPANQLSPDVVPGAIDTSLSSVGLTPGQRAGNLAASLGIGNVGQIASSVDAAARSGAFGSGMQGGIGQRDLQDQLAIAAHEYQYAGTPAEKTAALEKANQIKSQLSLPGLADFNFAKSHNLMENVPAGLNTIATMTGLPMNFDDFANIAALGSTLTGQAMLGGQLRGGMSQPDPGGRDLPGTTLADIAGGQQTPNTFQTPTPQAQLQAITSPQAAGLLSNLTTAMSGVQNLPQFQPMNQGFDFSGLSSLSLLGRGLPNQTTPTQAQREFDFGGGRQIQEGFGGGGPGPSFDRVNR